MKKPFGIFLAILFLFVQAASALHMAEHGFEAHKHNGHTCDIYLNSEQSKCAGASVADINPDSNVVALAPLSFAVPTLAQERRDSSAPRAPPAFP